MPHALIDILMLDCGVCYGQTVATKEVHQQNIAWVQIGVGCSSQSQPANLQCHCPSEHWSFTVEQWSPQLENLPVLLPGTPRRSGNSAWAISQKHSGPYLSTTHTAIFTQGRSNLMSRLTLSTQVSQCGFVMQLSKILKYVKIMTINKPQTGH